ncbi:MAG: hypothetical protein LBJ24_02905 [Treponema sp.]|nr:hypothetical protein [Treponema sp.]
MLVLKENEERLVEEVEAYLKTSSPEESALAHQRFQCLRSLGDAISRCPSIKEVQLLRGELLDEAKLVQSLCAFAPSSHLLHMPTRVVAARSFLIAKYHAFALLIILTQNQEVFHTPLREVLFSIVCTLMAEEVYFSCLEDPSFSERIKIRLAHDLIALWDSGSDPRSHRHLPALEALWTSRDGAPPSFGTMDGSSELMRLSLDMGGDWDNFLVQMTSKDDTRWALEEFLFGLSYEEIVLVRSRLKRSGISAVGYEEIHGYLGGHPAYNIARSSDPRIVYDFYVDRRDAAAFRKKISAPGPWRTLEEIYLKYRIVRE